jgi:hypothetical protein
MQALHYGRLDGLTGDLSLIDYLYRLAARY